MVHPLHRRVAGDPGVVDENIDRAELGFDLADTVDARLMIGDVEFIGLDPGAVGEFARALVIAGIGRGDGHSLVLQSDADRLADPARSAGYDLPLEP